MSRRAYGLAVALLWRAVEQRLRGLASPSSTLLAFLDGKPLPVGGCSKDRQARYGRGAGMMAKGYKLHAVWSTDSRPQTWEVTPLNVEASTVARRLIPQLRGAGHLVADGNYDVNALYDLAWQHGYQYVILEKSCHGRGPAFSRLAMASVKRFSLGAARATVGS